MGTISATVTDAATRSPIEGATVVVEGTPKSATTVADGTYTIDVAEGVYDVTASANGRVSQTVSGVTVASTVTVDFALDPDPEPPPPPPDLDCKDIAQHNFLALPQDPHMFDPDKNGIGCEQ